jgi:hypothetical protein
LRDHRSQQLFRPIGGYFANFSSSAGRISEAIYSQQAVYLSYTSKDLQVDQRKRDLGTLCDHRSMNSCKAPGYGKEFPPIAPLFALYFD